MKKLTDLLNTNNSGSLLDLSLPERISKLEREEKLKANIFALGDVGINVLIGLRLLGGDVLSEIGIYDINEAQKERAYLEASQVYGEGISLPEIRKLESDELFSGDILVFCASKGIPSAEDGVDVRMAQLDANSEIIQSLIDLPGGKTYDGMIFVLSDPVDPLAMEFYKRGGYKPGQIRGFGLGVMYARGRFYARGEERFSSFLKEGRAFGPHGKDLVLANSLKDYDDRLSKELTALAVDANMKVRELGFKPYIAPAFSSGALSIIDFLKGNWSYGSFYCGDENQGAFLGALSKNQGGKICWEDEEIPELLFERIEESYKNLLEIESNRRR